MRITPLDIKQKMFSKVKSGYPPGDVDAFLLIVCEELQELLHEKAILEAKLSCYERGLAQSQQIGSFVWEFIQKYAR